MQNSRSNRNKNIVNPRISSLLRYGFVLPIIIVFTLSSCSANRGIRLRNKSIKKWEKKERELKKEREKDQKQSIIYPKEMKGSNFKVIKRLDDEQSN